MAKSKIGIIGLGMIGGSLAMALGEGYDVLGYDADPSTREYASSEGVCRVVASISDMRDREIVFVCVPLSCMNSVLDELYASVGDGVIISDVGSVKLPFCGARGRYVGGHPMAGTERGGIKAAKPHLFENAYWCVTGSGDDADRVESVVKHAGAIPVRMTAEEHDRSVAAFSHLPHVVAYTLVSAALDSFAAPIAGSGFLDTTRIAQSDERFWTEVFRLNRDNVLRGIAKMSGELDKVARMLDGGDYAALEEYIGASKSKRVALNRADLGGETLYVDLVDRIGEFERITGAVSRGGVNIKNIALVPGRDGAGGALRLEFESAADKLKAASLLGVK